MIDRPDTTQHWTGAYGAEFQPAPFIEQAMRRANQQVGCSRTGLWVFDECKEGRSLHCLGMYDRTKDRMVRVSDEAGHAAQPYFDALVRQGHVVAHDARTHPATRAFFHEKLLGSGVRSLMASAFSLNGALFGAFTCTQVHAPVAWSPRQLAVLTKISSHATLALTHAGSDALESLLERRNSALRQRFGGTCLG
jgi:GAF domain-containing protein